jgi:hypothetical protein
MAYNFRVCGSVHLQTFNKTSNQMQQSIVKFIALSRRCCITCFGHYYAHHQEPPQTAFAASGFRVNAEVDMLPGVVGLCNKPTTAGNKSTSYRLLFLGFSMIIYHLTHHHTVNIVVMQKSSLIDFVFVCENS